MADDTEAVQVIARELRPTDFWNLDAEYPTETREEAEAGVEVALIEARGVIQALLSAGFILTRESSTSEAVDRG